MNIQQAQEALPGSGDFCGFYTTNFFPAPGHPTDGEGPISVYIFTTLGDEGIKV